MCGGGVGEESFSARTVAGDRPSPGGGLPDGKGGGRGGWLEEGVGRRTGLRTPDGGRPSDPQKHARATDVEGHIKRSRGGRIVINKFLNVVFAAIAVDCYYIRSV